MTQDKALSLLSIARKARRLELGEEPVAAAAKLGKARLVLLASDAGDSTRKRAERLVAGTKQLLLPLPYDKAAIGGAAGYAPTALAAITDVSLALAFVKALEPSEALAPILEALTRSDARFRKRAGTKKHQKPSN